MPRRWTIYSKLPQADSDNLHKLLGDLEIAVMEQMWLKGEATVRDVTTAIQDERSLAYTTVMTVMGHLADKGLLARTPIDKKTYLYTVLLSREQFLARSSQQLIDALLADFGEMALAQFVEVVEHVDPLQLERLHRQLNEVRAQAQPV